MRISSAVVESQSSLFPEHVEPVFWQAPEVDNPFEHEVPQSETWTDEEVEARAQQYIACTEDLVDRVLPSQPDVETEEWPDDLTPAVSNLTLEEKAVILRAVLPYELPPKASDMEALDYLGMALYYRKRLQHKDADAEEKRELIKRIYTAEEPKWTVDEIVGLHFILLDSCKPLARPSANFDTRDDLIRWIFTDAWRDDVAFSFKHCCQLWGLEQPGLGQLHERVREEMADMLRGWTREALEKKVRILQKRANKSGQADMFLV